MELEEWDRDAAAGRPFSLLLVDDHGYPSHGHLVWADSSWWACQFEGAGLKREPELERALHEWYDAYMRENSPARRSFYVFSKQAEAAQVERLAEQVRTTGSKVLGTSGSRGRPTVRSDGGPAT